MTENEKKKIAKAESFANETFTKLPNFLLKNSKYADISNDAKLLYVLMRTAFDSSVENDLKDEKGIYFYFTETKMSALLHKSRSTCREYKKELREAHLIEYDNDDYDPNTGKRLPTKFYMRTIEYSISDTFNRSNRNHGKKLTMDESKNENSENSDNSANPKTDKNSQAPQAYGINHGKKLTMVENDDENARSLDATAPLEENENSQAPQAYGINHGKKLTMVENDDVDGKTTDKSTISKNENFNNLPSTQQNQPWSKINHNKDNKRDTIYNSSMLHNNSSYSTPSIVTNKEYKEYSMENTQKNQAPAQRITNKILSDMTPNQRKSNNLYVDDIYLLANHFKTVDKTRFYVNKVNVAIYEAVDEADEYGKTFFKYYKDRVLSDVSSLLEWDIKTIEHPKKDQVRDVNDLLFNTVKKKVSKILKDPNELNKGLKQSRSRNNKRFEKGTDWSKKKAPDYSSYSTEQLKDLFKDLDNK